MRECSGYLVFLNGNQVNADILTWVSRPKKWFKGRGIIYLDIQSIPAPPSGKWHVGIFYCSKKQHNRKDHIFSLTAADTGSLIKKVNEKTEKIKLKVAVTRIDDEKVDISKPRVIRKG